MSEKKPYKNLYTCIRGLPWFSPIYTSSVINCVAHVFSTFILGSNMWTFFNEMLQLNINLF